MQDRQAGNNLDAYDKNNRPVAFAGQGNAQPYNGYA
jgi:hypothetical protein